MSGLLIRSILRPFWKICFFCWNAALWKWTFFQIDVLVGQELTVLWLSYCCIQGEKLLGSLGGIFSRTWKPKKTRAITGPVIVEGKFFPCPLSFLYLFIWTYAWFTLKCRRSSQKKGQSLGTETEVGTDFRSQRTIKPTDTTSWANKCFWKSWGLYH